MRRSVGGGFLRVRDRRSWWRAGSDSPRAGRGGRDEWVDITNNNNSGKKKNPLALAHNQTDFSSPSHWGPVFSTPLTP